MKPAATHRQGSVLRRPPATHLECPELGRHPEASTSSAVKPFADSPDHCRQWPPCWAFVLDGRYDQRGQCVGQRIAAAGIAGDASQHSPATFSAEEPADLEVQLLGRPASPAASGSIEVPPPSGPPSRAETRCTPPALVDVALSGLGPWWRLFDGGGRSGGCQCGGGDGLALYARSTWRSNALIPVTLHPAGSPVSSECGR